MQSSRTSLRHLLIGDPLATSQQMHERLPKIKGLAVFSSDALSSVAYATEEILFVLILAGTGALGLSIPVAIGIAILVVTVGTSYYQTIHAYPGGGGAYSVARDNLGDLPGLTAAGALLTDYILTVAVSTAAGVAAITSWIPALYPYRVMMGVAVVAFVTIINLRGVRESATVFTIPTYLFVGGVLSLLGYGFIRWATGTLPTVTPGEAHVTVQVTSSVTLFLLLRAFAAGCTALTGIEAVANGVQAFKPPEADNASRTLAVMVGLLAIMFLGITVMAHQVGAYPVHSETVLSQIGRALFGGKGLAYVAIQLFTALILLLASNTAFADFPRLSSFLARDGFLPRQMTNLGDRLVFSNGIIVLGAAASLLIVIFGGRTHSLLPLYAIGVFVSFTLSQIGMVRRWLRLRPPGWQRNMAINGFGATTTFAVLLILAVTRFSHGGWAVLLILPLLVLGFLSVKRHFDHAAVQLSLDAFGAPPRIRRHRVLVPVAGVHRGVIHALEYARSISDDVTGVYVEVNPAETAGIQEKWYAWAGGTRLEVLASPYRSIVGPLMSYVDRIDDITRHDEKVTIVLPQFVPQKWWQNLLHNQTAMLIRLAFLFRRDTIVTDVPYHLKE
jgi:amino acid transporter